MTHKELVIRAERWLRGTKGCSVVLTELVTMAGETPDAIGWKSGRSTLVECKSSRSDFQRDRHKPGRSTGRHMGTHCYYMAPVGVLKPEDIPPYWGLLEVGPVSVKVVKKSATRPLATAEGLSMSHIRQMREIMMLTSALRRQGEKARCTFQ